MTVARTLLGLVCVAACGPAVEVESSAGATGGHAPVTTSATSSTHTTGGAASCTPGDETPCECSSGGVGVQVCLPGGVYGHCTCSLGTSTNSGTTADTGQASDGTESSTGSKQPVECPEFPVPCSGWVTVPSNDGLLDVSMCTELDGSLWIIGTVSDISSLGCLTSVGVLRIESTELVDLSGLSRLERAEDLEIEGASALTQVGLPALTQLDRLTLVGNEALEQLDLPALTQITWDVDVTDNASLSNCEVEALLEQVGGAGGNVCYQDNARNACLPLCR